MSSQANWVQNEMGLAVTDLTVGLDFCLSPYPQRAKKVSSKGGVLKIGEQGEKLRNVEEMMLVLHVLADGDLSLKLKELHTGVT